MNLKEFQEKFNEYVGLLEDDGINLEDIEVVCDTQKDYPIRADVKCISRIGHNLIFACNTTNAYGDKQSWDDVYADDLSDENK